MKKYISILCLVVLAFLFSTGITYAKSVLINPALQQNANNASYSYSNDSAGLIYTSSISTLTPTVIKLKTNSETFNYRKESLVNKKNYFFEFTMVFHDRLQQLIAFFTDDDDKLVSHNEMNNDALTAKASAETCQTSS